MTTARASSPRRAARWLAALLVAGAALAAPPAVAATAPDGATGAAPAAGIRLTTPWMRPAAAGSDARAYVDIASDQPVTLVGASSPLARSVEIRVVRDTDGADPGKPVKSLAVVPGTPTRLAYKGNHLLLRGLRKSADNATPVPIVLTFRDAKGRRSTAQANLQVRGIVAPGG